MKSATSGKQKTEQALAGELLVMLNKTAEFFDQLQLAKVITPKHKALIHSWHDGINGLSGARGLCVLAQQGKYRKGY